MRVVRLDWRVNAAAVALLATAFPGAAQTVPDAGFRSVGRGAKVAVDVSVPPLPALPAVSPQPASARLILDVANTRVGLLHPSQH